MNDVSWTDFVGETPRRDVATVPALHVGAAAAVAFAAAEISDDRQQVIDTTSFPASSIAQLVVTTADGQTLGAATGVFIAETVVLTAAHAIFIPGFGPTAGRIQKMVVVPGRNGSSTPFGAATTTSFYVPQVWQQYQLPDFDYALAFVPRLAVQPFEPIALSDDDLRGLPVRITGYPIDKPVGTQWTDARNIADVSQGQLAYDINTVAGDSGASVAHHQDGRAFTVAIHRFEGDRANYGTRITPAVFADIRAHMPAA